MLFFIWVEMFLSSRNALLKLFRDDISAKTVPILFHHTLSSLCTCIILPARDVINSFCVWLPGNRKGISRRVIPRRNPRGRGKVLTGILYFKGIICLTNKIRQNSAGFDFFLLGPLVVWGHWNVSCDSILRRMSRHNGKVGWNNTGGSNTV